MKQSALQKQAGELKLFFMQAARNKSSCRFYIFKTTEIPQTFSNAHIAFMGWQSVSPAQSGAAFCAHRTGLTGNRQIHLLPAYVAALASR